MANKEVIEREEAARRATLKIEKERKKRIRDSLMKTAGDIEKEIEAFYTKYATKEGLSLAQARARVKAHDVREFAAQAAMLVKTRDFSPEANAELSLYNTTMKISRLEMLKSEIGLLLVREYDDLQDYFQRSLEETARQEFRRQAGILGGTVMHLKESIPDAVTQPFEGVIWPKRAWSHEALLAADIGGILTSGFITGKHPRVLAKQLRQRMEASADAAEILMVTEMSRVQTYVQKASYEACGFDRYEFIPERDEKVCKQCAGLDGRIFFTEAMEPGVNAPPLHARCRCSTAAVL